MKKLLLLLLTLFCHILYSQNQALRFVSSKKIYSSNIFIKEYEEEMDLYLKNIEESTFKEILGNDFFKHLFQDKYISISAIEIKYVLQKDNLKKEYLMFNIKKDSLNQQIDVFFEKKQSRHKKNLFDKDYEPPLIIAKLTKIYKNSNNTITHEYRLFSLYDGDTHYIIGFEEEKGIVYVGYSYFNDEIIYYRKD
ncbi:MAG: hypothetical protein MUC49_01405 [Raineya sp.]|jgi:hypothetical protein|nr:hypothetical protein [Raineya sp.]